MAITAINLPKGVSEYPTAGPAVVAVRRTRVSAYNVGANDPLPVFSAERFTVYNTGATSIDVQVLANSADPVAGTWMTLSSVPGNSFATFVVVAGFIRCTGAASIWIER